MVLTIISIALLLVNFLLIFGVYAILYKGQCDIKKKLEEERQLDVKVDFPAEMLMEIKSDCENIMEMLDCVEAMVHCNSYIDAISLSHKFKHGVLRGQDAEEINRPYQHLIDLIQEVSRRNGVQNTDNNQKQ